MEGKRAKFLRALQDFGALRCVFCGCDLTLAGDSLRCEHRHTFNINKKGSVNLLSRQAAGCYDAALFEARHRVLGSGLYEPVAQAILRQLSGEAHTILDAGCGEGWYLNRILTERSGCAGMGLDISKDAIQRATDQPCAALWCVGDLRALPLRDGSVDAVLDVLTPAGYSEFSRVLSPQGVLIKVYPGPEYLKQIRAAAGLADYEAGRVDAFLREKCTVLQQDRVHVTSSITPALWRDLVYMTPLLQGLAEERKQTIAGLPAAEITLDLYVTASRPLA